MRKIICVICGVWGFVFTPLWLSAAVERSCPAQTLTLSFVGDIMAHKPNFTMHDYSLIYRAVAPYFRNDDLTFANLEAPVNDMMEYRTYPRFNVQSEYLAAAIESGIEAFSLANNHINDWGAGSLEGTADAFARARGAGRAGRSGARDSTQRIYTNGIREDRQSFLAVQEIPVRHWRVGFVALTQFVNNSDATAEYVQIADYRSADNINRALMEIDAVIDEYDLFVVSYHGGAEYQSEAEEGRRQLFYQLAEMGVDIIWGHHPHVLQPWEVYRTGDGRRAVVMQSLGNFVSGQTWYVPPDNPQHERAPTGDSVILQVCVRQRISGLEIAGVRAVPISHYKPPVERGGVEVRLYRDLVRGRGVAAEWHDYYRARYEILREQYGIGWEE